jgi:hypothetical protein
MYEICPDLFHDIIAHMKLPHHNGENEEDSIILIRGFMYALPLDWFPIFTRVFVFLVIAIHLKINVQREIKLLARMLLKPYRLPLEFNGFYLSAYPELTTEDKR